MHPRFAVRGIPRLYWSTWQSGLTDANGRPKPSLAAYQLPFDLRRGAPAAGGGIELQLWGQLRLRPNGAPPALVSFQFRPRGSGAWQDAGGVTVDDPLGFYTATVTATEPGEWRSIWGEGGRFVVSRAITVTV